MKRFMRYVPFWKETNPMTEEFTYIEHPDTLNKTPNLLQIDPELEPWYLEDVTRVHHSVHKVCVSPLPSTTLYPSPLTHGHISPQSIVQIYPTKLQMPPPPPPPLPHPQDQRIMVQFDESKLKEMDIDIPMEEKEEDDLDMIKRLVLEIFN
jgi:hypothetical protein